MYIHVYIYVLYQYVSFVFSRVLCILDTGSKSFKNDENYIENCVKKIQNPKMCASLKIAH